MTPREELEHEPIEHDPTGMRELLSSLPDPGPMPEGLEAAILARLSELREEGDEVTGLPRPPARRPDADIVPLSAYGRSRPDRHRWFAAAAGIAAAAAVGIVVTDGLQGDGWITSVIGADSSSDAAGAPAKAEGRADGGAEARDRTYTLGSGTDYRAATLRTQASALLEGHGTFVDPATEPANAAACLRALGLESDSAMLDAATYEGRPAYVVVWTRGRQSSVVVTQTSCGDSGPHTIVGPTALG